MAGHGAERLEHARVLDSALDQVPLDHAIPKPRSVIVALRCVLIFGGGGILGILILRECPRHQEEARRGENARPYPNQKSPTHGGPLLGSQNEQVGKPPEARRTSFYHTMKRRGKSRTDRKCQGLVVLGFKQQRPRFLQPV